MNKFKMKAAGCWYFSTVFLCLLTSTAQVSVQVEVEGVVGDRGPQLGVTWLLPDNLNELTLTWTAITYTSQVSMEEVGRRRIEPVADGTGNNMNKVVIDEGLVTGQQYRVCLSWPPHPACLTPAALPHPRLCSYITIPPLPPLPVDPENSRTTKGPPLYLVLGPVHGRNVSVTWGELPVPRDLAPHRPQVSKGYRVTWRMVDGQVSHPGHSSNLVTRRHLIRGLIPGTRYEVCVGETLANDAELACDVITTQEDVPGPAVTEGAWCWSQAHGTHWRCDVTWGPPLQPRGTITGYRVEYRDGEGYTLLESLPRGSLCRPLCHHSATATFHPSTACVIASTAAGEGWESCVPIQDIRGRVLAYFELRVLVVIAVTIFVYRFGPAILKAILRCCVRGLYRHMEGGEKQHPV